MGIFSKIKGGIASKANAAIDKAIDPAKELDMAILELEEGRKKALQELVSYKATAKTLENDVVKYKAKAAEWEKRAMLAVKAGDDDAAKIALREKKAAETEAAKIDRDKHEAASYAIQLNKSRKEFETKLTDAEAAQGHARDAARVGALGRRRRVRQRLVGMGQVSARRRSDRSRSDRDRGRRRDARRTGRHRRLRSQARIQSEARCRERRRQAASGDDRWSARAAQDQDGGRESREAEAAGRGQESARQDVIVSTSQVHVPAVPGGDPDEALSTRLRDLALVELDALAAGLDGAAAEPLVAAFADDVADALREARARIAALRATFGSGGDPLSVLEVAPRQRASDAGQAGAERVRARLLSHAEAARAMARLEELAAALVPKLFEADRRR